MRYRKRYSINDENCAKIWNFTFIYIHCINHLLTPYPRISQKTDDLRRGPIPLEIESLCVIRFVLFPLLSFLIRSDRSDSGWFALNWSLIWDFGELPGWIISCDLARWGFFDVGTCNIATVRFAVLIFEQISVQLPRLPSGPLSSHLLLFQFWPVDTRPWMDSLRAACFMWLDRIAFASFILNYHITYL